LGVMQGKEDQFKQLPMLLPKETDMPNIGNSEAPLIPPRLPASTLNPNPAVSRPPAAGGINNPPASGPSSTSAQ